MKKKEEETEDALLKEYCIEGTARFNGKEEHISETVRDSSAYLAFKHLAKRLRKQRKQSIELYKCRIHTIKIFPPNKPPIKPIKKEKIQKQLVIHFF